MPIDERKRQKKLLRKRRKDRKRKKARLAVSAQSERSAKKKVMNARGLAIHECLINPSWRQHGLANILISRRQPDGNLLFGAYLVDHYCLGLKNTFCNANLSRAQYSELRRRQYRDETPSDCPLPLAHTIIYGGIDYAAQFGFQPDRDFEISQYVLEPRDRIERVDGVEFGKDGRPFFIAGPEDNVDRIIGQLRSTAGEGNFHWMFPLSMDEE